MTKKILTFGGQSLTLVFAMLLLNVCSLAGYASTNKDGFVTSEFKYRFENSMHWQEIKEFMGMDVGLVNMLDPVEPQVFTVTSLNIQLKAGEEQKYMRLNLEKMNRTDQTKKWEIDKLSQFSTKQEKNGYLAVVTSVYGDQRRKEIYVLFPNKDRTHILHYGSTPECFKKNISTFVQWAKSFRF